VERGPEQVITADPNDIPTPSGSHAPAPVPSGDDPAARTAAAAIEREAMAWPAPAWERPPGVWRPDEWSAPLPDVPPPAAPAGGEDGVRTAETARPASLKRFVREVAETLGLAGVMLLVLLALVRNYKIEGTSMSPTLAPAEYILVNKLSYSAFGDPARGDVIVFLDWNDDQDYIKRVIGLPGETVDVRDGSVWIDGEVLAEPYLNGISTGGGGGPRTLGPDEFFVLGDNRGNSSDSRTHGPLPRDHIVGRAWLTYWPLTEIRYLSHGDEAYSEASG